MDIKAIHEANRKGWNEGAVHYAESVPEQIEFLREGGKNFCPPEFHYLKDLNSWCHRAVHLQCAGGTDTLSLLNLGATEVAGVDISESMLTCARQKTEALGAKATWYRSDVLETPHDLDGTADLVYTGRGALCWIMDIDAWAAVVVRLLKPGGKLYVFEGHPITWVWDSEAPEYRFDRAYGDYFTERVMADSGWPTTYIGDLGKPKEEHAVKYEKQWTLGTLLTACVRAGLALEELGEHPDQYWDQFPRIPADLIKRLPQTFSLLMRKPR